VIPTIESIVITCMPDTVQQIVAGICALIKSFGKSKKFAFVRLLRYNSVYFAVTSS